MFSFFNQRPKVEQALMAAVALSGSLLVGAHIFEAFGYAPCELCLDQREAHWTALGIAALGLSLSLFAKTRTLAAAAVGVVALIYLLSTVLAGYHTGVEFGFWPGPSTCGTTGPVPFSGVDLDKALDRGPTGPSCGEPLWRLFGVSMAGYNMLFSAAMFVFCALAMVDASRKAKISHNGSVMASEK